MEKRTRQDMSALIVAVTWNKPRIVEELMM